VGSDERLSGYPLARDPDALVRGADRLATSSPVPGREWKFLDNAGWHVVPEECIAIADGALHSV